ncbi:uncharacterized protein M6B38_291280 [Iris pallida]|uniref:Uncharacterized protein n=1 Tax=Iris pallida TaxID=29817 RepID=A0AAX6HSY1_IRIPA|nr:uncharacterized protein M6B38_291280 [Iris pallida]
MASPENTKSAPKSPPVQDSPIYQYVSSLSPIKPVNARSSVQAYDNIDVPSPQLVFKTPNFSRQRNLDLLERSSHMAATGSETLSPAYAGNNTCFSGSMDVRGPYVSVPMSQLISCNLKGCGSADPSPDQPTVSPSSCVDAYLADPVETDDNLSSSPDFCVKRAVKDIQVYRTITDGNKMKCFKEDPAEDHPQSPSLPVKELVDDSRSSSTPAVLHVLHLKQDADLPHTQNDSTGNKESTLALQAINAEKDASSIGVESLDAPQNEEHLGEVPITGVSLTASHQIEENLRNLPLSEEVFNKDGLSTGEKLRSLSKNDTINTESPLIPSASTQQHNVVNQYAVDNLVASVSKDCDMGSQAKENISISSLSQGPQDHNLLASKAIRSDTLDCTSQLHPDSPHNIQEGGSHVDNLGLTVSVSTGKQISYNQEDGVQYQRGKRKRLQFESVENLMMSTGCNNNSCSHALEDSIVESPITPLDTENVNASHAESITVSNSTPVIKSIPGNLFCRLSVDVDIKWGYQGTTQGTAPRPSGIGLHLNSIGGSGPTISNSNMQMPTRDASVQEKCFVEHNDQVSQKLKACLAPMSTLGPPVTLSSSSEQPLSYAGTENYGETHEGYQAIIVPNSSVNYHSPMFVKPLNQSLPSKLTDLCMTPCTMKMLSSEELSRSGDSTQSSPRKKRHEEGS